MKDLNNTQLVISSRMADAMNVVHNAVVHSDFLNAAYLCDVDFSALVKVAYYELKFQEEENAQESLELKVAEEVGECK